MRLIDADALLKHKDDHEMISTHLIWNAPTIEPKGGEWIDRTRYKGFPDYECSVCTAHGQAWMNYCPSCGARMKGADDE